MKIDGFGPGGRVGGPKKSDKAKGAKKSSGKSNVAKSGGKPSGDKIEAADEVQVSSHSETLDMIRDMVGETPDVRVEEVERIVNEMKSGKFKVNFEKVAEGFIREAIVNEMSKRQTGQKA